MVHDWLDIALGGVLGALGWLLVRFVGRLDELKSLSEKQSRQIVAIATHLGLDLDPFM
jgi:hypothetical protein